MISLQNQTYPKGTIRLQYFFFFFFSPASAHCLEFFSAETFCVWGISVLQLIKSISGGNKNTLTPIIALKISFQEPKRKMGNAAVFLCLSFPDLPQRNACGRRNAACSSQPGCPEDCQALPSLAAGLLPLTPKTSPIRPHSFLCLSALAIEKGHGWSAHLYKTSWELALPLKPAGRCYLYKRPLNWESKCWSLLHLYASLWLSCSQELPVDLRGRLLLSF